ncbi:MAG: hypothetical protein QXG98_05550 [Candidatus Micrarchaeia archaeon]
MGRKASKASIAKALAGAPPKVRKLLRESELILGGLLKITGEAGDVIVKRKGKAHNARWVGRKVRIKPVSEIELHGIERAYKEVEKRELGDMALLIKPEKPVHVPMKARRRAG